jgi:hypothetical protein
MIVTKVVGKCSENIPLQNYEMFLTSKTSVKEH